MTDWYVNECAGRRWRTLPNGIVEIEGEGAPVLSPSDPRFKQLAQTWGNWASYFQRSAAANGVPLSWMVAIATVETGAWAYDPRKQETIGSNKNAGGVMQFLPGTAEMFGFCADDRFVASKSIEMGARFLKQLSKRYDGQLPEMAAAYNAGSVVCSPGRNEWNFRADANYPRQAVVYNNTALRYLSLGSKAASYFVAGLAFASAVAIGFRLMK